MRERKGNWKDLLASHSLAVDTKKLWLGFVATLATIALITIIGSVYTKLLGADTLPAFNLGAKSLISRIINARGMGAFKDIMPLFNPFAAGIFHFALSIFVYIFIMAVWSYCGGAICRLTALQYGRDDIPTLNDGLDMVRDKRNAFFFAPLTPLFGVILFAACNMVIGLIGSVPYVGPWIMAISIPFIALPAAIITTFIIVLGVATFGLMFPAVSIGGKDAFEGWSSAYSYLLWGFNRFVGYTLLAAVVGLITTLIAAGLAELFIYLLVHTISIGLVGQQIANIDGGMCSALIPLATDTVGLNLASWITVIIGLVTRALVVAYAFSFFFTANTIICFLLRKHVDRIEIDEVYEETPEEETFDEEFSEKSGEVEEEEKKEEPAQDTSTEDESEARSETPAADFNEEEDTETREESEDLSEDKNDDNISSQSDEGTDEEEKEEE